MNLLKTISTSFKQERQTGRTTAQLQKLISRKLRPAVFIVASEGERVALLEKHPDLYEQQIDIRVIDRLSMLKSDVFMHHLRSQFKYIEFDHGVSELIVEQEVRTILAYLSETFNELHTSPPAWVAESEEDAPSFLHSPEVSNSKHAQIANMSNVEVEQMLQDKGLNAPRITPAMVKSNVKRVHYFTAAQGVLAATGETLPQDNPLSLLTLCVVELQNRFSVLGRSACASPENFDAEVGQAIAYKDAEAKIWPLMAYELRSKLHGEQLKQGNHDGQ